jgi:hypothetical protein
LARIELELEHVGIRPRFTDEWLVHLHSFVELSCGCGACSPDSCSLPRARETLPTQLHPQSCGTPNIAAGVVTASVTALSTTTVTYTNSAVAQLDLSLDRESRSTEQRHVLLFGFPWRVEQVAE